MRASKEARTHRRWRAQVAKLIAMAEGGAEAWPRWERHRVESGQAKLIADGWPFDVSAARSYAERLIAEGERLERERLVFMDWTREQGLGPECKRAGAFTLGDAELAIGIARGRWNNQGLTVADIQRRRFGGWPGPLAREWGTVRCEACEGKGRCEVRREHVTEPLGNGASEQRTARYESEGWVVAKCEVEPGAWVLTCTRTLSSRCKPCKGRGYVTALLWACTVETTETLTSPPMPSEAEGRAWAAAAVMGGRMEIIRPQGVSARRPGEPREFVARVTRPLAVDVGKCPACVARSGKRKLVTVEWGMATAYGRSKPYIAHPRYLDWQRGWGGRRRKRSSQWVQHYSRPCPDCNGTGRELREVARLVLDAAPRPGVDKTVIEGGFRLDSTVLPGDPQARDRLAVAADQLQAAGERLGTWHALGLAGRDDAAAEMAAWLGERTTTPRPVAVRWSGLHPDEFPGSDFP